MGEDVERGSKFPFYLLFPIPHSLTRDLCFFFSHSAAALLFFSEKLNILPFCCLLLSSKIERKKHV
jgi:hypothetical protein